MYETRKLSPIEVVVNPNFVLKSDVTVTLARLDDATGTPRPGETIIAYQPDEDGSRYSGFARVISVDTEKRILSLRVAWNSFSDKAIAPPRRTVVYVNSKKIHRAYRKGASNNSTWAHAGKSGNITRPRVIQKERVA